ncbi:CMRF35-like molecule 8 [Labeo rohita]|uniref:CMRF35-like molecule 8 n=1 Tax=Labeo rohita TaxID=84645 RepID=A0A498NN81_LABRO|nr:CMRF35-like molecule 8 [Labeo rohita]
MENSLAVTITGSVGSNISVTCSYPETYQNNSKFFCQMSSSFALGDVCVRITQQETRSEQGRLVLLDDTSAHVLTANISGLAPEDSGKYWCGVDIAQLPDFTLEIWITVTKEQTTDLFPKEPGESYSRFMMMVAFICVGALFFVCLFGLFQVLKRNSCSNSACLRDTSCAKIGYEGKDITFKAVYPPDYETNTKYFGRTHDFFSFEKLVETSHPNRTNHRPVPKRAWRQVIVGFASTASYSRFMMMVAFICVGVLFFVCLFGLFQVLKRNSCSNSACLRDTCCAKIGYEGKDITFKAMYPPDYETNTKYFGRTHDFFSFEKLVETSHPNRWVKQGRYILFDNTSAHFLTARILRLVAGDSGSYSLGVDIKLLPDFIADEIQLTVITGEAQRPTTPAPKGVNPSHTGRYALYDEGSDFTVTIADLRLSDSGTYICAVDRLLVDTYNYVTLRVIEDSKRTSVTRQSTADTSPKTIRRSALSDPLVYVGAGLGALVLIFTVVLFIFIKLKYKLKRRSSCLTSSAQPDSLIYTTPNVTSQSDSLDYSFVKFIKKPNCSVKTSLVSFSAEVLQVLGSSGEELQRGQDLFRSLPPPFIQNAYEKGKPAVISKSDTAQSDDGFGANKFHRPAHTEAVDADLDYINVAAALRNDVNPDQICTELDNSHIYQSLTADSFQKDSIYHIVVGAPVGDGHRGERLDIRCPYESGYESHSKYLCKGECYIGNKNIRVESGSPAKDKRFSLTDNRMTRVFTVTITDLRTEDEGQFWCAVETTLPLPDIYLEIILQVKLGNKTTEVSTISSFSNTPSYFSTTKVNPQSTSTTITERKETITDQHKSGSFVIIVTAETLVLIQIGPPLVKVAFLKEKED